MARPQRIEYEGAVYHVTVRGNERRAIFQDDADRGRFLCVLGESVERFDVRLYLFCLMSNHVHLVVETPRANLGQFMHRVETAYTVYFNRRHGREDVAFRRRAAVLSPDEVLTVVCERLGVERTMLLRRRRDSLDRAVASRMLCHHAGLTQRQAAHTLAIRNGASVSGQLSRLARELQSNRSLRNRVQKIEDELKRRRDQR